MHLSCTEVRAVKAKVLEVVYAYSTQIQVFFDWSPSCQAQPINPHMADYAPKIRGEYSPEGQGVPINFKPQITHASYSCIRKAIPAFGIRIIQTSL